MHYFRAAISDTINQTNLISRFPQRTSALRALKSWMAALWLLLFVILLYRRLLLSNQVLASGDILHYFYPYRDYAAEALRHGRFPLWNPYIFLGVPFLANPQSAVLYPFHWPLSWLPVTKQIYWSAAFHTWWLGMGVYCLMRRFHFDATSAFLSALVVAGSGFYGGMIGHINQMNCAAWLPWAILALERRGHWRHSVGLLGLFVALMIFAGHTQTLFINLIGLGLWALFPFDLDLSYQRSSTPAVRSDLVHNQPKLRKIKGQRWRLPERQEEVTRTVRWITFRLSRTLGGLTLGLILSLAQLIPTLELSALGLRSGGLSFIEATSFSLNPLRMPFTLLPSYGLLDLSVTFETLGYSEFVAYVGLGGLFLAGLALWHCRSPFGYVALLLAGAGLFLALGRWNPAYWLFYQLVPGFSLFRTPARWLMLYTLGMGLLCGLGAHYLSGKWKKRLGPTFQTLASVALVILVGGELILAARALPHTQTTAPQAVSDVRTAPAHLLTDPQRSQVHPAAAGRFLSMSTIPFDPGDMADYRQALLDNPHATLDLPGFEQLVIALKSQEILAPNLSLLWRIPSVDGFDGGVLPLQRYIQALSLFVPDDETVRDGRLREQLTAVPDAQLLGLLHVQYLFTDKVEDVWYRDIYYDRQIGARLGHSEAYPDQVELSVPREFEATRLDLIGAVEGSDRSVANLTGGKWDLARVVAVSGSASRESWELTGGGQEHAHWADSKLNSSMAASSGAEVAYKDVQGGRQEYVARFAWAEPSIPASISVELTTPETPGVSGITLLLRAATLVDERTGMFLPLLPSDRGAYRLVHSGDVKIYENMETRPRAYLAYDVEGVDNVQDALRSLKSRLETENFYRSKVPWAVAEGLNSFRAEPGPRDEVQIIRYAAEHVELFVRNESAALLVLSDTYYPGWRATVNGKAKPIVPANSMFRAVPLQAGSHRIQFEYRPYSWRWGIYGTIGGVFLLVICLFRPQSQWTGKAARTLKSCFETGQ